MREIKFRAWDKDNGVMIYPDIKNNVDSTTEYTINAWCDSESDMSILMQFTGLKDRNEKEVYEGDILHHHYGYGNNWVVKWESPAFVVYNVSGGIAHRLNPIDTKTREVIGNIYENSELLLGVKDAFSK